MKPHPWLVRAIITLSCLIAPAVAHAKRISIHLVYEDQPSAQEIRGWGSQIPQDKPGLLLELLRMTAQKMEIEITFERLPWKRCLYTVQNRQADGLFPIEYTRERLCYLSYPGENEAQPDPSWALRHRSYHFFTLKDSLIRWDGLELHNHGNRPVATNMGYAVGKHLSIMGLRQVKFTTLQKCFEKLQQGLVGSVAALDCMAQCVLKTNPHRFRNVVRLEPPFRKKPCYLAFSKQFAQRHPELVKRFWETMRNIHD